MEHAELASDPRFSTTASRISNRAELLGILDGLFAVRDASEWLVRLEAADVPVSPINELPDVFANEQILHRNMLIETTHSEVGTIRLLANPIRLSDTPIRDYTSPPFTGEHTREVLGDLLGLDSKTIDALSEKKAI